MGRSFSFDYDGRRLAVRAVAVDEGWELWVMEGERRLACGARVSVEDAVLGGRAGRDLIQLAADDVRHRVLRSELALGPQAVSRF